MLKNKLAHLTLGFLFLLEACAPTLPMIKKNSLTIPKNFPAIKVEKTASEKTMAPESVWDDFFHDQKLNSLINIALENNQELHILDMEINIANNDIMARQGEYLPKFNAVAGGGIEKIERFSSEDANGPTKFGRLGVMSTWEIDIWKKLRNATKSAYFNYLASVEGRRFLVTNLVAEIANTYFELMTYDNQLQIVSSYIDLLQKITGFVQLQQQAGRVTSLPVKRFTAEVLKNQGRKFELNQQIIITQNKLNRLLGRFPQPIRRDWENFDSFSLSNLTNSIPVKLLENRPDIREASFKLEAAKLDVEVAKARFYPSLSIDSSAGYENFNSRHFESPVTTGFYGVAANLTAPILNRKGIKADYFSSNNRQIQAIYHYEQAMIEAYGDVVNQMNSIKNYDSMYSLKKQQVEALNESIEISNTLFKAARVDYVESLLTQRDSLEAQIELVDVKKQQLTAYVNLYKALGGGWRGHKAEKLDPNNYDN
jgi:outer membrane protein, multidrug efflux system